VEWAFLFFSPSTGRLAYIAADGREEAQVVRESVAPSAVPTFSSEAWQVDSDRALWAWWNRRGEDLMAEHPETELVMQLRVVDEEAGQPVWTVAGLVPGAENVSAVVVRATDGVVVEP
jgi:hypothetical protein